MFTAVSLILLLINRVSMQRCVMICLPYISALLVFIMFLLTAFMESVLCVACCCVGCCWGLCFSANLILFHAYQAMNI